MKNRIMCISIASASLNPAKIFAVEEAAKIYYDEYKIIPVNASSGVSKMPTSKVETRFGAKTRVLNALRESGADIAIAHEGGVCHIRGDMHLFSACVATNGKEFAWGGETIIRLPSFIVEVLDGGNIELGDIIERHTGIENARTHTGATAFLTNKHINRKDIFRLHSIMALAYFANDHSRN